MPTLVRAACRRQDSLSALAQPQSREAMPLAIAQRVADKPLEQKALRCAIRCGEWRGNPLGAASK
ncbi:hypothetical protein FNW02_08405 [Komarekiella sp. 'clone 1']|uniref:Uncharacterized protein n=1 Tax=Komarekiella delphini-convector SJRDD-AB1 TaxID=2593771 RepID=A0AA40SVK3_9NOST|nr:hypothetical protein [Komarekiella delphini-convector]MBD6615849.1 hypothetical protein [Komarekiella delphini-convector SJRDD-AB1]